MIDTLFLETLLATGMLDDAHTAISAGELIDGQTLGEAIDWSVAAVDAYNDYQVVAGEAAS